MRLQQNIHLLSNGLSQQPIIQLQKTVLRRDDFAWLCSSCLEVSFADFDLAFPALSLTLRYLLSRRFALELLLMLPLLLDVFLIGSFKSITNISRIFFKVFGSPWSGVLLVGIAISRSTISSERQRGFASDTLRRLANSVSGL